MLVLVGVAIVFETAKKSTTTDNRNVSISTRQKLALGNWHFHLARQKAEGRGSGLFADLEAGGT